MSKCTPITAKAKQSPFKANEALIEGAARAYGSVKGKDKQVTETKTIKGDKVEKFAETPEEIRKWKEAMKKNPNAADRYKDKTVTTTKTVPGEDLDYSTTLKTAVKGDVFTPQERRQESRDTKKSYRDEKRSRIKAARAEGKLTKAKRKEIKADVARKKADDFTASAKRGRLSKQSGLAPGASGAYLYDRDVSLGERTDKQQLDQAKKEALRRNNNGFSGSSTSSTPNYGVDGVEKFKNFLDKTKTFETRTFGGPKMRSSFKMKGYGKKN